MGVQVTLRASLDQAVAVKKALESWRDAEIAKSNMNLVTDSERKEYEAQIANVSDFLLQL